MITLWMDQFRAELNGRDLGLRLTEFQLLKILYESSGRYVWAEEFLDRMWEDNMLVSVERFKAVFECLREKLGPAKHIIQTVRGRGYRLITNHADYPVSKVYGDPYD